MQILLTGATGFIGSRIAVALRQAGHRLVLPMRHPPAEPPPGARTAAVDFLQANSVPHWLPLLAGVDVVINAVGILQERGAQTFDALHVRAPCALFDACVQAGVKRVVQISALGADEAADTGYHLSKKAADDHLLSLPLEAVVVQPSLVFGLGGASTSLFLKLATLPLVALPDGGRQTVQPVHVDDLVEAVCRLATAPAPVRGRMALVGPRPMAFGAYLGCLRAGLGQGAAWMLPVPASWVGVAAHVGGYLPGSPLDPDTWRMLQRGNAAPADATTAVLGRPPRSAEQFVPAETAGAVRRDAQLGWLLPGLRLALALMWLWTAAVSFGLYPVDQSLLLLQQAGVPAGWRHAALYGAAALDLVLGLATLWPRASRGLWGAQAGLVLAYTAIITVRLPGYWLHPYGPIVKNLPLLAVLGLLWVLQAPARKDPPWTT
jgi:uncharacterized protein YbjT (DUF2867 family)